MVQCLSARSCSRWYDCIVVTAFAKSTREQHLADVHKPALGTQMRFYTSPAASGGRESPPDTA
ncbi:hypothetical protein FOMPIDRAFT_131385 [Fomitopsis schrenkii]|uniref:Uncharacterized protein n=1 Tax=Fomitopsis schrenkii TaxID=2126942 RepID=S8FKI0_FOMSC|nr:hypothetical protein FOMPIDRAFT_131385 [Fomitopsis schrenkii]